MSVNHGWILVCFTTFWIAQFRSGVLNSVGSMFLDYLALLWAIMSAAGSLSIWPRS